jgi:hypothetical protein
MQTLEATPAGPNHPKLTRFTIRQIKLAGLEKPTDVDLQFWVGKFWLAQVHLGENDTARTETYLRERYGAPDYQDDNYMTWNGKTAAAVLSRRHKTFEVHDEGMSNEARRELLRGSLVHGDQQVQATAPATAAKPAPSMPATPAK